jgi:hypothetical protein
VDKSTGNDQRRNAEGDRNQRRRTAAALPQYILRRKLQQRAERASIDP